MGLELGFQGRAANTGLDARGSRLAVDLDDLVEAHHAQRHHALEIAADGRLDTAHHGASAAEGNDGSAGSIGPVEHTHDLFFAVGKGHHVGQVRHLAGKHTHGVGERLAQRVHQTVVGIARADPGKSRRRRQTRHRQLELLEPGLRRLAEAVDTEAAGVEGSQSLPLVHRHAFIVIAPAPEFESPFGHGLTSVRRRNSRPARLFRCPSF